MRWFSYWTAMSCLDLQNEISIYPFFFTVSGVIKEKTNN